MLVAVTTQQQPEQIAYSIEKAAEAVSLSVPYLRLKIKAGELKAKLVGRRVLILRDDLSAFLSNQEDWKPENERNA